MSTKGNIENTEFSGKMNLQDSFGINYQMYMDPFRTLNSRISKQLKMMSEDRNKISYKTQNQIQNLEISHSNQEVMKMNSLPPSLLNQENIFNQNFCAPINSNPKSQMIEEISNSQSKNQTQQGEQYSFPVQFREGNEDCTNTYSPKQIQNYTNENRNYNCGDNNELSNYQDPQTWIGKTESSCFSKKGTKNYHMYMYIEIFPISRKINA